MSAPSQGYWPFTAVTSDRGRRTRGWKWIGLIKRLGVSIQPVGQLFLYSSLLILIMTSFSFFFFFFYIIRPVGETDSVLTAFWIPMPQCICLPEIRAECMNCLRINTQEYRNALRQHFLALGSSLSAEGLRGFGIANQSYFFVQFFCVVCLIGTPRLAAFTVVMKAHSRVV